MFVSGFFVVDCVLMSFFFFKQKTAYEMRISDWSSDVCSSDLRKGGRIYIEVRDTGEIDIHEGYVTAKEAARLDKGETIDAAPKTARPELTARMQTYTDLHRHAAVRGELTGHPAVPLRLMVAHAIQGSPLRDVKGGAQNTSTAERGV